MCFSSFGMVVFSEDLSRLFMLISNVYTNHLKCSTGKDFFLYFFYKVPSLAFLVVGVAVVTHRGSDAGDHRGAFRAVNASTSWRGAQSPGGRWKGGGSPHFFVVAGDLTAFTHADLCITLKYCSLKET